MDWLDEKVDWLRNYPKKISTILIFYLLSAALLVTGAWLITSSICISWQRLLLDQEEQLLFGQLLAWNPPALLPDEVRETVLFLHFLRYASLLFFILIGIVLSATLFCKRKIQQPLLVIHDGVEKLKKGNLDQSVYYQGQDEFEEFAKSFEEMRISLKKSQQQIQTLHEEQRKINAAFSHDLRTPLTVIQNNVEMIETFYPTKKMSDELMEKSITKIKNNITRLTNFSETMKSIQQVDDWQLEKETQPLKNLLVTLQDFQQSLAGGFSILLEGDFSQSASFDLSLCMEVIENLVSNALRFKKNQIELTLQLQDNFLFLFVKDDGPGFSKKELYEAIAPYYSREKGDHFGLGLTIASTLVKKHGGVLKLANGAEGGAIVSAIFSLS